MELFAIMACESGGPCIQARMRTVINMSTYTVLHI